MSPSFYPWPLARRLAFRWLAIYLVLYQSAYLAGGIPKLEKLDEVVTGAWAKLSLWLAALLHVDVGTGALNPDSAAEYVRIALCAALATLGCTVWSLVVRGRYGSDRHDRGWALLHVFLRYSLFIAMMTYALYKVVPAQFPAIYNTVLEERFGESSPMRLLWTLMSASPAYGLFGGLAELTGTALLCFRRTATLGALILIAVLTNVVVLNFSYDVSVKMYSGHLLAMAAVVAAPDLPRFAAVLLGEAATPSRMQPPFVSRWLNLARWIPKLAFIAYLAFFVLRGAQAQIAHLNRDAPLRGVWDVEEMTLAGRVLPPSLTEPARWRRLMVEGYDLGMVRLLGDDLVRFQLERDAAAQKLVMHPRGDGQTYELGWTLDGDELRLEGTASGSPITVKLRRATRHYLLLERGFHWVTEYPFNQ